MIRCLPMILLVVGLCGCALPPQTGRAIGGYDTKRPTSELQGSKLLVAADEKGLAITQQVDFVIYGHGRLSYLVEETRFLLDADRQEIGKVSRTVSKPAGHHTVSYSFRLPDDINTQRKYSIVTELKVNGERHSIKNDFIPALLNGSRRPSAPEHPRYVW